MPAQIVLNGRVRLSGEFSVPWAGVDDPIACGLHLAGALFFGWQAAKLVRRAGEARRRAAALAVFAGAGVLVLATSALYHGLPATHDWKLPLQRADHAAIFVLIAGTLTVYHAIGFHGRGRFWLVGLTWALALGLLVAKNAFWSQVGDGYALYMGLSATGLGAVVVLPRRLPWQAFAPMVVGAALYVAGACFDAWKVAVLVPGWIGPHEVFHVAVLCALAVHWSFFSAWAIPGRGPGAGSARSRRSDSNR